MALTSLQVCMDSSDWLQGTIHEDQTGMDSSSSPSGDMLTCSSRPLMERRLRPPHDQALKCPRCDSTHTKFCYYNNYSLSQPRYFCKTCRRYWTKGGTLRNIPVGGGCRKNKKVSSNKKGSSNVNDQNPQNLGSPPMILSNDDHNHNHQHHLQLSFPQMGMGFSHHQFGSSMLESPTNNFMFQESHVPMQPPIDFMVGGSRSHDFMGSGFSCEDSISPIGAMHQQHQTPSFHNLCSSAQSPFTMYMDSGNHQQHHSNNHVGGLMLPYEGNDHHQDHGNSGGIMDVKPNAKHLALEWHDPQQNMVGKDHSFDYFNGVGSSSWPGLMNGYGTSAANPLV